MNEILFDRNLLALRKSRFERDFANHNFLHHEIANRILENLNIQNRKFANILEIGAVDDFFAKNLNFENFGCQNFLATRVSKAANFDLKTDSESKTDNFLSKAIICDDENFPAEFTDFDLIISNLNLHFINNLPQFLTRIRKSLKGNGIFIASFFGERNLSELAEAIYLAENEIYQGVSPIMPPMIDVKTAANLLTKAGFQNAVSDFERIVIEYSSPLKLLNDIKKTSSSNLMFKRSKRFFSKRFLNKILEIYCQKFSLENDEKASSVKATFEIVCVSGENK